MFESVTGITEAEVLFGKLESKRIEAQLNKDRKVLSELLSPEMTYLHSNGRLENKNEFINFICSTRVNYLAFDAVSRRVVLHNDKILFGESEFVVEYILNGGSTKKIRIFASSLWEKINDGWLFVRWQATLGS